jgi:hypothetical protein
MRTNQLGVFYWDDTIPMAALLEEGGTIDGQTFLASWRAQPQEAVQKLDVTIADIEAAKARLGAVNLFVLAHRPVSGLCDDEGSKMWCVHALVCCKDVYWAVTSCRASGYNRRRFRHSNAACVFYVAVTSYWLDVQYAQRRSTRMLLHV